jgi:RNA 2',3'-cyclic 3'-phosphodiesterase
MARLRTFIAVDLGKNLRSRCIALQETLSRAGADVKWVEEKNLHVTLLFLGEVNDRSLPAVCRAVALIAGRHEGFSLSVETVGCFPNVRRPRVVWAGVGTGAQELVALHAALEPPLLELGCYRREERQYTPHITLGRVRGEQTTDGLATALTRKAEWQAGAIEVSELLILSSELMREGPVYTVLGRGKLRRPGNPARQTDGRKTYFKKMPF